MIVVYITLAVIVVGSFVTGVILILKDNKTGKSSNDVLYDDPKDLFDDSNDMNKAIDNLENTDKSVDTKTDELFDDEII